MGDALKALDDQLHTFQKTTHATFLEEVKVIIAATHRALVLGVVVGLLSVAVLGALAWWVGRMVADNLRKDTMSLQELAHGEAELPRRVMSEGKDEVGALV